MDGLSGLFKSPEKTINANLNTSLVRVIYIITTLVFVAVQIVHVEISPKPLKHKTHFSVAYYSLSFYFQTSQATEMLLKHCKRQHRKSSFQKSHSLISRGLPGPTAGKSPSPSFKSQPLHCNKVVFLKGPTGSSWSRRCPLDLPVTGSCPPPGPRSLCQCHPSCQCPRWSRPLS